MNYLRTLLLTLLTVLVLGITACGSTVPEAVIDGSAATASTSPPADSPAESESPDTTAEGQDEPVASGSDGAGDSDSGGSDSSDNDSGEDGAPESVNGPDDQLSTLYESGEWEPYGLSMPSLPPVVLPDVSELGDYGNRLNADLSGFLNAGLDVVTVECPADGSGELYVGESGGFLDAGPGSSGTVDFFDDEGWVNYTVNEDGSGEYLSSSEPFIMVEIDANGAGSYYRSADSGADTVRIDADGQGHGEYTASTDDDFTVVEIGPDQTGRYRHVDRPGAETEQTIDFFVDGNGFGSYSLHTEEIFETHSRTADRETYRVMDEATGETITLTIDPDGSGTLEDTARGISIFVDSDLTGSYWLDGENLFEFPTNGGILDPRIIVLAGETTYSVADRFPALDTLPPLAPVCATVIRIDSSVLFDFDSDELRASAVVVLEELARTLDGTGQTIEIHGHTDSIGGDDYNLDLSERRAAAVLAGLIDRGLTVGATTTGFGETRPIAENETETGADNPAGRQLNRRVEIVLRSNS